MTSARELSRPDSDGASIPPIAHWIWFGQLPNWVERNLAVFRALHPDWDTRIWQTLPPAMPPDLVNLIESLPWFSSRSDVLSYWLLQTYGGVYFDADIVVLRPMDQLRRHPAFLASCVPEGHDEPELNCALMGSAPQGAAVTRVIETCRTRFTAGGPFQRTSFGPLLLTSLFETRQQADIVVLPAHYFYPLTTRDAAHAFWTAGSRERTDILTSLRENFTDEQPPYAVHLWGVDGSSQRTVAGA